ncbi:MAG: hypothetical protein WAK28_23165 [Trebonia sp.]
MTALPSEHISLHPLAEWLPTFREAGVDLLTYDGMPCSEAAGPLAEAVQHLETNPGDYKFVARRGEIRVIDVLRWAAEHCAQSPQATMTVRVRDT